LRYLYKPTARPEMGDGTGFRALRNYEKEVAMADCNSETRMLFDMKECQSERPGIRRFVFTPVRPVNPDEVIAVLYAYADSLDQDKTVVIERETDDGSLRLLRVYRDPATETFLEALARVLAAQLVDGAARKP